MEVKNTMDMDTVASFNAIIYGPGGVGKTTMASTFPKPLLLDFENGAKYFKSRGISLDTIQSNGWPTDAEKVTLAGIIGDYETIILDPIGTAMNMLIDDTKAISGTQFRNRNGGLTIAGWGEAKGKLKKLVTWLIATRKNVILIAHVDEIIDEESGQILRSPSIPTKLKFELMNMVDVVAYFDARRMPTGKKDKDGNDIFEVKRFLNMKPGTGNTAKDRTGKLGEVVKPEWDFIKNLLEGALDPDAKQSEPEQPAGPSAEEVDAVANAPEQPQDPAQPPLNQQTVETPVGDIVVPNDAKEVATIKPDPVNIGQALLNLDEVIEKKRNAILAEGNMANVAILKADLKALDAEKLKRESAKQPAEKAPVEEPEIAKDNFDKSTVPQLMDVATALGKDVPAGALKADIIKILRA